MLDVLLSNAAILIALVLILWLISVRIGDVSFIDAFWGAGMGVLAVTSYHQLAEPGALSLLILLMTCAWGFRLGLYLFLRWQREGEDKRYKMILKKDREKGNFAIAALTKVWLMQAILLFMVSSPAQVGVIAGAAPAPITPLALAGLVLWTIGVSFEWIGDWQLSRFKADPANHGLVLDTGLWRYTRHPNYFGDACAWWGIWLACAGAGWDYALYTLIGPLFLTFTLTKWSGAALLERGLGKSRGDRYADYKRRTSAFFPLPPRR
ncbi:MAG: hypothetical protein APF82_06975 [Sphingomonadales bacterium BRH_c42]|nr:MAG: hypothetical protein APF82_06975 [Sphingomonadales bacterium BRH_c42]